MAITDILTLLIIEREKLNRAIEALQIEPKRRGRPPGRRLGRPPGTAAAAAQKPVRKRRGMSRANRVAQSKRMKAFWAARRKGTAKTRKSR